MYASDVRALLLMVLLAGCSSAAAPAQSESTAPEQPEAAEPAAAPSADCTPQRIRRAGLDESSPACVQGIERLDALSDTRGCTTDADCTAVSLAGGCLGTSLSRAAAQDVEPLPAECAGEPCAAATFDDHVPACIDGCCLLVEH